MNKHSLKILKISGEVAIIVLVLLFLAIGLARSFFPFIDRYRPNLAEKISTMVDHPVTIDKLQTRWRGWSPAVRLENVQIYDKNHQQVLLQLKQVHMSVNILSSLWHWQLVPNKFFVSGGRLIIHQLGDRSYDINGMSLTLPQYSRGEDSMQNALHWLTKQNEVAFEHLSLDYYPKIGNKISFADLQLRIYDGFFEQRATAAGVLTLDRPSPFRFVIKLKEELDASINAKAYLAVRNLNLKPLSQWLHWQTFSVENGYLPDVQVWISWQKNQVANVQTLFHLQKAQLTNSANETKKQSLQGDFSGNIFWENDKQGWSIAANQIKIQLENKVWPLHQFNLVHTVYPRVSDIFAADNLDIQQLSSQLINLNLLSSSQTEMLSHLDPQGKLTAFYLQRIGEPQQNNNYEVFSGIRQIATQAWEKYPGINNLQGKIHIVANRGHAELQGQNFTINLAKLESHSITLNNYNLTLDWLKAEDGWRVSVTDATINSPSLNFEGNMDLYLYADDLGGPYIRLLGGFSSANLHGLRDAIPDRYFKPELASWLRNALVSGRAQGQLLLQGPLQHFPFDDNTGRFQLLAEIQNMDFNYKTQWPILRDVNIILQIDDRHLLAEGRNGKIFNQIIPLVNAEIPDLSQSVLSVTTNLNTNASFAQRYVLESPLEESLGDAFRSFTIDAPMHLNLGLTLPFYHGAKDGLQMVGEAKIFPGTASLLGSVIQLQQFQGDIQFTEDSVDAANLKANWLSQPVTITIATSGEERGQSVMKLLGNSKLAIDDLVRLSNSSTISKFLSGETTFTAGLVVRKVRDQNKAIYTLDTDLKGVAVKLPAPWGKAIAEKAPTHVEMQFVDQGKTLRISLTYDRQLSAAIVLQSKKTGKWDFRSANLHLGAGEAEFVDTPGISVDGNLASLNWTQLSDYLQEFKKTSTTTGKSVFKLNQLNVGFGQLQAFGMKLSSARIKAQSLADGWNIQIDSPTIAGQVSLPNNPDQVINGNFQRFIINKDATSGGSSAINPGKIPPLNLQFQNLVYGSRSFGSVSLITNPAGNAMQIQKLSVSLPGFMMSASGLWQGFGQNQMTNLSGSFTARDMGNTLKKWQVTGSLLGAAGTGSFNLKWPGPAYSPNLPRLNGKFSFALNKGQIINMGQSSQAEMGIGRILNLLSLQSLPRRLSLDFSDLVTEGFPFDRMSGDFLIRDGNAVSDNTQLKGSVAQVDAKGRIGLAAQDYNLLLIIAPKLTGSLPIAATIVGGPVVGAAAWVANKLVEPVVGQITSITYRVTGPWTDPVMQKAN